LLQLRIESSDIIIFVIDVKQNFNLIKQKGIENFIKDHIKEQLELNLALKELNKDKFDDWLLNKEIIISFNKKDLLNKAELACLNESLKVKVNKFSINKISCSENDNQEDLAEFLNDLKIKVSQL
jgi:hypothetical protein